MKTINKIKNTTKSINRKDKEQFTEKEVQARQKIKSMETGRKDNVTENIKR